MSQKQRVELSGGSMQFTQDCDSCDATIPWQFLDVSVADAGAGKYYVLKTNRWAFDSIEELVSLLEGVKKAFQMDQES